MLIELFTALAAIIAAFLYWQDNGLVATQYIYSSKKISPALDGFIIAHLSDLHGKRFGKDQDKLARFLRAAHPDLVVITGDLIDCRRGGIPAALECIKAATSIAPVYYIPGNHEKKSSDYPALSRLLSDEGVHMLENRREKICRGGEPFFISGVLDIEFLKKAKKDDPIVSFTESLQKVCPESPGLSVLLSHRPEYFDLYAAQPVDLVFSGHAHGGQIRLPGIGGLFSPQQGWRPAYTSGFYQKNDFTLCVSRGLGNSKFPFRFLNRPEIVLVTLKKK